MTFEAKVTPWQRLGAIRTVIEKNGFARLIEAHNGISGLIGETASVMKDGRRVVFDGFWESSLTDSASKGLPDVELIGSETRLTTIDEILTVTTKPLIVDGATGGESAAFRYLVQRLERRGVSAVIIEDKVFPKRNSLDSVAEQHLEDPGTFAEKITAGKEAQVTPNFMVIARLESLIVGQTLQDALNRAEVYIQAGADGIMIHDKGVTPDNILEFAKSFKAICTKLSHQPILVSVPTTYNSITDKQLVEAGFQIVIHANHLMRASHKAMQQVAELILTKDRSLEADDLCVPVRQIFETVGYERIVERDKLRAESKRPKETVIIPAAGRDSVLPGRPKSLLDIAGKSLLKHQLEGFGSLGLRNVFVVRGHRKNMFDTANGLEQVTFVDNPDYESTHSLRSLFCARQAMRDGFLMAYSDVLFSPDIIAQLMNTDRDIVLAIDDSYQYHRHDVQKRLDLVAVQGDSQQIRRTLTPGPVQSITSIGKKLQIEKATHEFIGLAYFSAKGAHILAESYDSCLRNGYAPFQESPTFATAAVADMIQELIDRDVQVSGLGVHQGWIEVHNQEDIAAAEKEVTAAAAAASR